MIMNKFVEPSRKHVSSREPSVPGAFRPSATPERYCSDCHPYGWPNGPMPHEPGCTAAKGAPTPERREAVTLNQKLQRYTLVERYHDGLCPHMEKCDAGWYYHKSEADKLLAKQNAEIERLTAIVKGLAGPLKRAGYDCPHCHAQIVFGDSVCPVTKEQHSEPTRVETPAPHCLNCHCGEAVKGMVAMSDYLDGHRALMKIKYECVSLVDAQVAASEGLNHTCSAVEPVCEHEWSAIRHINHECLKGCGATIDARTGTVTPENVTGKLT